MLTYLLLFGITYIFAIFDVINGGKYIKNYLFLVLVTILTLFAGLRYNLGADYLGYYSYFNKATISLFGGLELGFEFLAVLVRETFGSYEIFVLLLDTLTFVFVYKSIKSMSKVYLIPLYIYSIQYFLGGPMGQMRQALAMAILLYSIKYVISRDLKRFIFVVLIATSIHFSSIVFLVVYGLNYIKVNKVFLTVILISSVIVGKTFLPRYILLQLFSLFDIELFDKINHYVTSEVYGTEYSGQIIAYIERLLIFFISLYFYKESDDKRIKVFIQVYWLSLLLFFMFADISILAQRSSRPFKMVEIFLYGYLIEKFTHNKYLRVIGYLVLLLLMYKPIYIIISRPYLYIPYMSILGK